MLPLRQLLAQCSLQLETMSSQEVQYRDVLSKYVDTYTTLPLELRQRYLFRCEEEIEKMQDRMRGISKQLDETFNSFLEMEATVGDVPEKYRSECRTVLSECCRTVKATQAKTALIVSAGTATVEQLQAA